MRIWAEDTRQIEFDEVHYDSKTCERNRPVCAATFATCSGLPSSTICPPAALLSAVVDMSVARVTEFI